jgi:DNA-binding MarR family transcriptional regulator
MKSHASTAPRKTRGDARTADGRAPSSVATRTEAASFVDGYLPALLAQAAHLISGEFHPVVSALGFTVSEWRVLATLAGGEPMSIGRLAEITTIKQPTVTRLLDRMEDKGYVRRREKHGDRRVTLIGITRVGSRIVGRLIPLAKAHEQRVLESFGLQRAEELKSTLRCIIELHRPPEAQA